MKPQISTLSNGMTLINVPVPHSETTAMMIAVAAGSRDETYQTAGLAHVEEHLLFKRTAKRPKLGQISLDLAEVGAESNAMTAYEYTGYWAVALNEQLGVVADVLSDMVCNGDPTQEDLDTERNPIIQEISAEEDPLEWIFNHIDALTFGGGQTLSWNPGGRVDVVQHVTLEELTAYRKALYDPRKMAIIVIGGAQLSAEQAEKLFANLQPTATTANLRQPARWVATGGRDWNADIRPARGSDDGQCHMLMAVPGIPVGDPDSAAFAVFNTILSGGSSSRLFMDVRDTRGLCYDIEAMNDGFTDIGRFEILTTTRPQDAVEAARLAWENVRRLATEEVPQKELDTAKVIITTHIVMGAQTMEHQLEPLAQAFASGQPIRSMAEKKARIQAVTAADVKRMAQRIVAGIPQMRLALVGPADLHREILAAAKGRPEVQSQGMAVA